MKLVYLHNTLSSSEKANLIQVISMCNAFASLGVNVTLILPAESARPNALNSSVDFKTYKRLLNRKIADYFAYFSIKKVIKKIDPQICFVRTPLYFLFLFIFSKNIIYELHHVRLHDSLKIIDKFYATLLIRLSYSEKIFKIILISEALKNYWVIRGVNPVKSFSFHDGFDRQLFKEHDKQLSRRHLKLPEHKIIITYAGSLYFNREIESIIMLAQIFTECLFIIAGGPEKNIEHYKNLSEAALVLNIQFLGRVPHERVPIILSASDILLALWSKEVDTINFCSPLKIFEYMSSGRTIVAHGFPTIKEVLEDNIDSLLVKPGNKFSLIRRVKQAIELNGKSDLGSKAKIKAEENYSWQTRARKVLEGLSW